MFKRTWHGWLGLVLLAGACALSLAGVQAVRKAFYALAWWGYILALDGYIQHKQKNSLLVDRQAAFWFMVLASAVFWFGWELINLRLLNWRYLNVEPRLLIRWPLCVLAFSTVLPGVLLTFEALSIWGKGGLQWGSKVRPLKASGAWVPWFFSAGAIMLLLSLIWPRLFFPLVWGALIFLLEPVNYRLGLKSLMRQWEQGDLSPFVRLLLAGVVTGFLWESLNFLSLPRWQYSLPYLAQPKLFAMPLAGYGGFPPFAVECYVFFATVSLLRGGRGWEKDDYQRQSRPYPGLAVGLGAALFCLGFIIFMLGMIDRHLVASWAP